MTSGVASAREREREQEGGRKRERRVSTDVRKTTPARPTLPTTLQRVDHGRESMTVDDFTYNALASLGSALFPRFRENLDSRFYTRLRPIISRKLDSNLIPLYYQRIFFYHAWYIFGSVDCDQSIVGFEENTSRIIRISCLLFVDIDHEFRANTMREGTGIID